MLETRPLTLRDDEHRKLLDAIDKIRSQGIGRYVDLPEIVVVGDQSAGKSSVLEAISHMSFPTKDELCTRFATELILRRDAHASVKVSIIPDPERSEEEQERIREWQDQVDMDHPQLDDVVEAAKDIMGITDSKRFSADILRVELSGPDQPHLTMVDLPGIFRAGSKGQSIEEAVMVRTMVRKHMQRPRSIILAVISAKSDIALQDITELAAEVDPERRRTLGLITKPDTLPKGSDSELRYVDLAENRVLPFDLGWHVLKNRDYSERNCNTATRNSSEAKFFKDRVWSTCEPRLLGVHTLVPKLSNLLKNQIQQQLPDMIRDIEKSLSGCRSRLDQLGTSRSSLPEQRQYLSDISQDFSSIMKAAVDGVYHDAFFGTARSDNGYEKRLRAVVQKTLTDFSDNLHKQGRKYDIVETSAEQPLVPPQISRAEYNDEVRSLMERSRGCELPGTFNPQIITQLFVEQCQPWQSIASQLKTRMMEAVHRTIEHILNHIAIPDTASVLLHLMSRYVNDLRIQLDSKVDELLRPHQHGHPITYNHHLVRRVRELQSHRRQGRLETSFKQVLQLQDLDQWTGKISPRRMLDGVYEQTEVGMELHASDLAIDYTQVYHEMALNKFVDDVGAIAVEQCLISKLPELFTTKTVSGLSAEEVHHLAAESDGDIEERERCKSRIVTLENAKEALGHLSRHKPFRTSEDASS